MKTRKHIKSKPINIQKLINSLGPQRASASLGITPSAIMKYIRVDKAPLATELAAQSIVAGNSNQEAAFIMRGSPDLLAALKVTAVRGGGRVSEFK